MLTWGTLTPGGGYSVRKLRGGCRGPLKIGIKKIEGKMVFGGQKDRILRGFVPKRSFLCWWMRKNTPKRSSLVPRGSKKGVKTAAHMYHPSYREYPPPRDLNPQQCRALLSSVLPNHPSTHPRWVKSCFGRVQNSGITYQLCVLLTCCLNLLIKNQYHGCSG